MARRKKYQLADFPDDGTVFVMPLENGRVGVCRVVRKELKEIPCALVVASDWIGDTPPQLSDPAIRRILLKNHHNWTDQPEILWVASPPPNEFKTIGKIDVLPKDRKLDSGYYGEWDSIPLQILAQWRWDNERETVLAEAAAGNALESIKRKEAIQKRGERLATITLPELLEQELFPSWKDYPPKVAKAGCQRIIQSLILALNAGEKPLPRKFVAAEVRKCLEALNQWDARNQNFIETVEREDLCGVLEDIVSATKFPGLIEKIEEWKDW
jgi:hypothetical protein